MASGSARRPLPMSPPARRPSSGATTCTPRLAQGRRGCPAPPGAPTSRCAWRGTRPPAPGWRAAWRSAGRSRCPRRRCRAAGPWPGTTTTRSAPWPSRVCGIGSASSNSDVWTGSDASAENVTSPTKRGGARGQHRHDVGPLVDEAAADVDRLVGGDAAGDTEDDAPPVEHCGPTRQPAPSAVASPSAGSLGCTHHDLVAGDLLEGDRQRLAGHGGDLRGHDRPEALAELVEVGVDLPGAHGAQRDQARTWTRRVRRAPRSTGSSSCLGVKPWVRAPRQPEEDSADQGTGRAPPTVKSPRSALMRRANRSRRRDHRGLCLPLLLTSCAPAIGPCRPSSCSPAGGRAGPGDRASRPWFSLAAVGAGATAGPAGTASATVLPALAVRPRPDRSAPAFRPGGGHSAAELQPLHDGGGPLGVAVGLGELRVDDQGVAVLHEQVARIAETCRGAGGLAGQQRFGIGRGAMRLVAALLAVEVDLDVAARRCGRPRRDRRWA